MKVENPERTLLRVDEVAALVDVNPETVRRWIARGEFDAYRLGHGPRAPFRVDVDELERWLHRGDER